MVPETARRPCFGPRTWSITSAPVVSRPGLSLPRARPASAPYHRGSARCRLAVSLTKLLIVRDEHGYSSAKLPLYFEWHGKSPSSQPLLLLLHGGGSTIESNWGRLIPALESSPAHAGRRVAGARTHGIW